VSVTATSLQELPVAIQELERLSKSKADFIIGEASLVADTRIVGDKTEAVLLAPGPVGSLVQYSVTPHAVNQVADRMGIPREYSRKMFAQKPSLWARNVNTWAADSKKNILARTMADYVRAVTSDKYRVMDSLDLFFATYPVLKDVGAEITSASVSDWGDSFYLRAIVPGWEEVIRPGVSEGHNRIERPDVPDDTVVPGIMLRNSETGNGGLTVSPFMYRRVCSNGLVLDDVIRKVHLGSKSELGYLSAATLEADSKVIWMQVQDLVRATFDRDTFKKLVADFAETGELSIKSPVKAVDNVVHAFGLSDDDRQAILDELVSPSFDIDPGRTVYGLINAVTNRAKAYADEPDRVAEFERIGGAILREPELVLAKRK
jgi:hypothetical protein